MTNLIGEKIGMTQVFKGNKVTPVTLVKAGPCPIIYVKTEEKDGYNAIQIGYGQSKHTTKPLENHLKKSKVKSIKACKEYRVNKEDVQNAKLGESITVESFKIGDKVDVIGTSKGKGFAGVMKRHGFSGMPASHGHEKQRIPGSIGGCYPQRVVKGRRMAGHMGSERVTIKNLTIVDIDIENNTIALEGAIPGKPKSIIQIISK